jgi:hypothetical protein
MKNVYLSFSKVLSYNTSHSLPITTSFIPSLYNSNPGQYMSAQKLIFLLRLRLTCVNPRLLKRSGQLVPVLPDSTFFMTRTSIMIPTLPTARVECKTTEIKTTNGT